MRHILLMTIAAATVLAGCSDLRKDDGRALEWDQLRTTIQRSSGAQVFEGTTPIKVLVARRHGLDTYELRRCGGDTAVCGSRQGDWRVTREFDVITRAYPGVPFYLSPGGDGHATIRGRSYALAWGQGGKP